METKRLVRCNKDRIIGGVCAGLGDYLSVDTTIIRLAFILLALFGGHGILVYLIMLLIIPSES
jgi:phage shock protein C